jgi:hypothetical protein
VCSHVHTPTPTSLSPSISSYPICHRPPVVLKPYLARPVDSRSYASLDLRLEIHHNLKPLLREAKEGLAEFLEKVPKSMISNTSPSLVPTMCSPSLAHRSYAGRAPALAPPSSL